MSMVWPFTHDRVFTIQVMVGWLEDSWQTDSFTGFGLDLSIISLQGGISR